MGAAIGGIALTIVAFVGLIVAVRMTRSDSQIPPKRREFNRVKVSNASAQQTLDEITEIIDLAQELSFIDQGFIGEIRTKIKEHRQRMKEIDK